MDVKDQTGVLQDVVAEYPRAARTLVTAVLVLFLAGFVGAAAGWDFVVAAVAGIAILGTAVGVLWFTARSSQRSRY